MWANYRRATTYSLQNGVAETPAMAGLLGFTMGFSQKKLDPDAWLLTRGANSSGRTVFAELKRLAKSVASSFYEIKNLSPAIIQKAFGTGLDAKCFS